MKWNRFTLKTKTDAEDMVICTLAEVGIEGVEIQDKKFVFVLQSDNTVKNTEIKVSNLDDGKNYLVTNGLKSGDKIVVEGVQILKDGQEIQPITREQQKAKYDQALKDQHDGNLQTAFN